MDVDATRAWKDTPAACFRCGQVGHFKNECPRRFDIRFMTLDEKQAAVEEALAALDVVPREEVVESEEADFPTRSG